MFPEIFKKSFLDQFATLASDKVVNVRISLAHTIASHIKAKGPLSDDIGIKQIIEVLKKDKSRDVRSHFIPVQDYVASKEAEKNKPEQVVTPTNGESVSQASTNQEANQVVESKIPQEKHQDQKDQINAINEKPSEKDKLETENNEDTKQDVQEEREKEITTEEKGKQQPTEEEPKKQIKEEDDKKVIEETEESLKQQQVVEETKQNHVAEKQKDQLDESQKVNENDSSVDQSLGDSSSRNEEEDASLVNKDEKNSD